MDAHGKNLIYSIVIDVLHSMDDKFILKGKINMHMYMVQMHGAKIQIKK